MRETDLTRREQMPTGLRWFDDRRGIGWRTVNLARGFSPARTARFLVGSMRRLDFPRPVFIVGAPRSGTTMMFHLLRATDELASLPGEGHNAWRMCHHPRYGGWTSDSVGAGQVRVGEARMIKAYFYAWCGERRFVEKTPENALRVPYLLDLFPDARFIAVRRNPCDVISSLISGWRRPDGRFRSYYVPQDLSIPGYGHPRRWCFALVDGWRELASAPIPEIAFEQWRQCVAALAAARSLLDDDHWLDLPLESLRDTPDETLDRICAAAAVTPSAQLRGRLDELLAAPPNAASPPAREKWRTDNPEEISGLLPKIAAHAALAGYEVDPAGGDFRVIA